ncbi:hypothetical protein P9112_008366 [Eukaryota sp. TZLM1-RC]
MKTFICVLFVAAVTASSLLGITNDHRQSKIVQVDTSTGEFSLKCPWSFGIHSRGLVVDQKSDRMLAASIFDRTTMVWTYKLGTCDVIETFYQIPVGNPLGFRWSDKDNGFYLAALSSNHTLAVYFSPYGGGIKEIARIYDIVGCGSGLDGTALSDDYFVVPAITANEGKRTFIIDLRKKTVLGSLEKRFKDLSFSKDGTKLFHAHSRNLYTVAPDGKEHMYCEGVFEKIPTRGGFSLTENTAYIVTSDYKGTHLYSVDLKTCESKHVELEQGIEYVTPE